MRGRKRDRYVPNVAERHVQPSEAALMLGLSTREVQRMCARGELLHKRVGLKGRRIVISVLDIQTYLSAHIGPTVGTASRALLESVQPAQRARRNVA